MIELTLDYEKAYLTNLSCHVNWRLSLFALCVHFSLRRCQNEPQATVRLRTAGGNVKRGLKSKMYHLAFQLPDLSLTSPLAFVMVRAAVPFSMNSESTSSCPFRQAVCSGVSPA